MKAGSFNIHDYLGKLYENADEKILNQLNESESSDGPKETEGVVFPEGESNKAYNWLKKEFQKGKTEVKVEMSSHTFKPGYNMENDPKSTKDFPGMYGQVKTGETKGEAPKQSSFPETKFPGSETEGSSDNKIDNDNKDKDKNESSEGREKKTNGISVEAKTKEDTKKEEPKKEKKKEDKEEDK